MMRSGLSNDRAGLHKELGFLLLVILIAGCTVIEVPAPKRWDCTLPDENKEWTCQSLVSNRIIECNEGDY